MFKKILDFFSSKKEETEVVREEVEFDNIEEWLEKKSSVLVKEVNEIISSRYKQLNSTIEDLKTKIKALEQAKIKNPEKIENRIKTVVKGNRDNYVRQINNFVLRVRIPKEVKYDTALDFVKRLKRDIDFLTKSTEKSYYTAQHLFFDKVDAIAKTIKLLYDQMKSFSEQLLHSKLRDLEKVKEKVSRIKEDIKIKKDRKARLEENKKDIQQYEENKKEIEAKIEGLKKGEEYKELNELKAKKNYAKKHIALQKDKLIQLFSSLERPLRKYQRINETEERFIEYYLENSIKALLEDKQFKILTVLHDMKKSIINNTLELKDKKRDKALETINRLDLEYLEGFVDKLKELKNRREEIDNMLRVNKVISNISEYEYRLEHVQDKINRTQHDITLLESSLKTDDMPKIKQRLSENILKVINVEVNIL